MDIFFAIGKVSLEASGRLYIYMCLVSGNRGLGGNGTTVCEKLCMPHLAHESSTTLQKTLCPKRATIRREKCIVEFFYFQIDTIP